MNADDIAIELFNVLASGLGLTFVILLAIACIVDHFKDKE